MTASLFALGQQGVRWCLQPSLVVCLGVVREHLFFPLRFGQLFSVCGFAHLRGRSPFKHVFFPDRTFTRFFSLLFGSSFLRPSSAKCGTPSAAIFCMANPGWFSFLLRLTVSPLSTRIISVKVHPQSTIPSSRVLLPRDQFGFFFVHPPFPGPGCFPFSFPFGFLPLSR